VDVDVALVVRQVVDLLRAERPIASIEIEFAPALPMVHAVPDAVKQVMWNVLRNACEAAGPSGRVTVRVRSEGACVAADVEDDGRGKPPGAGMGLSICNELLRRDGGSLGLEPLPAGGCRARVRLPAAQPEAVRS
jgi:signal transduction histidine kinase